MIKKLCLLLLLCCLFDASFAKFKKVCYYTSWSQYRIKSAEFLPEDIDPFLCTHVIYSFAKIDGNKITNNDESDLTIGQEIGFYDRVLKLKEKNAKLKVLLSIGGWTEASRSFENVVSNPLKMQEFAKNAVNFLRKHKFDGLSVDWELPTSFKKELTKLLETFRIEIETDALSSQTDALLLAISCSALKSRIDVSYEIKKIVDLVDFINLIAYDLHGSWESTTGFHTALYARKNQPDQTKNVNWAVGYWLQNGCPREKLILGLAFYGRGFKLVNPMVNEVGSPSNGSSAPGKIVEEAGFLAYFEVCQVLRTSTSVSKFNQEQKVSSVQLGYDWIGYEDERSIAAKAEYVRRNCLGGVMIWSIDFDDFKGTFCESQAYPLLNVVNDVLLQSKPDTCPTGVETVRDEEASEEIQQVGGEETTSNATITEEATTETTSTSTSTTTTTTSTTPMPSTTEATTTTTTTTTKTTTPTTTKSTTTTTMAPKTTTTTTESTTTAPFTTQMPIEKIQFKPYVSNCHYFHLSLANEPFALVKCPNDLWFNIDTMNCGKERPIQCAEYPVEPEVSGTNCPTPATTTSWTPSTSLLTTTQTTPYWQTTTTSTTTTTAKPEFKCPKPNGSFPYKESCNWYWECTFNNVYLRRCPTPLVFNPEYNICDYQSALCPSGSKQLRLLEQLKTAAEENNKLNEMTTARVEKATENFYCPQDGMYANENDCRSFIQCSGGQASSLKCPDNLEFDSQTSACVYEAANCH